MAKQRMDLSAFVGKLLAEEDGGVLREGVRVLAQALMEAEVTELVGAERHERNDERTGYRNGSRPRVSDTRVGTIELAVPIVRPGSYYPSLLQPRRRAEQALRAVVQEAYVHGVSTRKVDELVKALGLDGISKSQVSRGARACSCRVPGGRRGRQTRSRGRRGRRRRPQPAARRVAGPATGSRPPSTRGHSRSACVVNGRLRHTGKNAFRRAPPCVVSRV